MAVELKKSVKGVFCWADLNTTDTAGARKFYTELFGWGVQEFPMPSGDGVYAMASLGGKNVAGIAPLPEEARKMGAPPHWLNYIATHDVDATVKSAQELGAKVYHGPVTYEGMGRMAVLADPQGAVFALWQSAQAEDSDWGLGEPGHTVWQELLTNNIEGAKAFYSKLFDYTTEAMGEDYTLFKTTDLDKPTEAGMMQIIPEMGEIPPHWGLYFAVADCDATANKAAEIGGKILKEPENIPGVGRFAVLQDPQGGGVQHFEGRDPAHSRLAQVNVRAPSRHFRKGVRGGPLPGEKESKGSRLILPERALHGQRGRKRQRPGDGGGTLSLRCGNLGLCTAGRVQRVVNRELEAKTLEIVYF
jgi:predicted enzyme related to lactoylglutathione lyase